MNVIEKLFGTHSERELKMIRPILAKIENLRPEMIAKSDEELRDQTRILKAKLADGATLDDILPEAFATVREAARRTLNMEHFPVQLIGGIVLHQGRIAEMRTGEGKTLVSTCPAYLNALKGKGVQIVTVNDYLAKRDAEWMGQVHRFLGLTVGVVLNDMNSAQRKEAYACDITYVTNNELGFDYLRDNMSIYKEQWFCVIWITVSSMRLTLFLLMRQEHLLLFQDRVESLLSYMNCVMCLQDSLLKVHIMVKELRCRL